MRALIVEDDAEIARLIAQNLEREGFTTLHCAHAAAALREGTAATFDIILLDRMLPDGDGLTICRELRRTGAVAPILMLTARGEIRDRVEGLETGADDYLVKPFAVDELLARVGALVRRSQGFAQLKIGDLEVDRLRRTVLADGRPLDLTGREYALLMHLAQHRERVVPRTELLAHVWSTQFDPGSNTVEVHISRLRDKLGPRAWMIDTVRGKGYRLRETQPGA